MAATDNLRWLRTAIAIAAAASSVTAVIYACFLRKNSKYLDSRVRELENSLKGYVDKCASERQGRIRAQQALRKALAQDRSDDLKGTSYPLASIAVVQSCFSTRNGTPRQPLLVPLARGRLVFDSSRVPLAALEGLSEYSHCWILYVFHLNTDLEKLWKDPSRSKFKAKVRVPRLRGGKKGVFATRSPHRPCPIGLTVAKVEAVQGHMVLLSGVDLVDGTPVLDIKPYLPYCDSIEGAKVPEWVKEDGLLSVATVKFSRDFFSTLADCWVTVEKKSLYSSSKELESLIKQVLSWDIRSLSQRDRPHESSLKNESHLRGDLTSDLEDDDDKKDVIYHLLLEGLDISYRIDTDANVVVAKVSLATDINGNQKCRSNMT